MPRAPTAAELRMRELERQRERAREWASRMGLTNNTGAYNIEHDRREQERRNALMNPVQVETARINIPTAATAIFNDEHDFNMENRGGKIKKSRKQRKSRKSRKQRKSRKSRKQRHTKSRKQRNTKSRRHRKSRK